MFLVKFVAVRDTTEKLLMSNIKEKVYYDVLDMTVEEALHFFENVPSIKRKIQTLYDVGLSYIKLGQPSTTAFRWRGTANKACH